MSFSDFLEDLFAGSTRPLGGIKEFTGQKAAVGQIFSGINYLQALRTSTQASLQLDLQGGKFKYFSDKDEKAANNNANDNNEDNTRNNNDSFNIKHHVPSRQSNDALNRSRHAT